MQVGAIDTSMRIRYRRNPLTGDLEYRYEWEDDNLGGFFSSAWKKVTGAVKKVTKPVYSALKTVEKKIIRPVIKPAAALATAVFVSPQAGIALHQALQAKDQQKAAQAAEDAARAAGAPVEIPPRSDVADKASYDRYMIELDKAIAAKQIANVRYWAKQINALPLVPAGSIQPPTGGLQTGMTLPPGVSPYLPQRSPSSIGTQFIPGTTTPLPPGYAVAPDGAILKTADAQAAQAGIGDIPMPVLLGGGALLMFMLMQEKGGK